MRASLRGRFPAHAQRLPPLSRMLLTDSHPLHRCRRLRALALHCRTGAVDTTPTPAAAAAAGQQGLKVYISVDIEGVVGIAHWDEAAKLHSDYPQFAQRMTAEVRSPALPCPPPPAAPATDVLLVLGRGGLRGGARGGRHADRGAGRARLGPQHPPGAAPQAGPAYPRLERPPIRDGPGARLLVRRRLHGRLPRARLAPEQPAVAHQHHAVEQDHA